MPYLSYVFLLFWRRTISLSLLFLPRLHISKQITWMSCVLVVYVCLHSIRIPSCNRLLHGCCGTQEWDSHCGRTVGRPPALHTRHPVPKCHAGLRAMPRSDGHGSKRTTHHLAVHPWSPFPVQCPVTSDKAPYLQLKMAHVQCIFWKLIVYGYCFLHFKYPFGWVFCTFRLVLYWEKKS